MIKISITNIVGSQWGDEGKGKIVDAITKNADIIVRYQGGDNAGHTVVVDNKTYKFHILPSGVLRDKRCLISTEVVLNPLQLENEIKSIGKEPDLGIDPRTHIIFPYHIALDIAKEKMRKSATGSEIGTTFRGIGPCYSDVADRTGITFSELVGDKNHLEKRIKENYHVKRKILKSVYNTDMIILRDGEEYKITLDEIIDTYISAGESLRQYITDVASELNKAISDGKKIVFEGAQGTLLDIHFGNYPKVTSSHPMSGAIFTSAGIPPQKIRSIGVMKGYVTKVGSGPVVTCLDGGKWPVNEEYSEPEAIYIRKKGNERGATTGRPRRVGWLDLVVMRYSCMINGFSELALTKMDVLAGLKKIKIAVAYKYNGKIITEYPAWDLNMLSMCKPIYKEFNGFKTVEDKNAMKIVNFIEKELKTPITIISTGPGRDELIYRGFEPL